MGKSCLVYHSNSMNEKQNNTKSMKLKTLLITEDGENWLCVRQYYATDFRTNAFLDVFFQGAKFKLIKEHSNESTTNQPRGSGDQGIP
jgi:hypothetical protein